MKDPMAFVACRW